MKKPLFFILLLVLPSITYLFLTGFKANTNNSTASSSVYYYDPAPQRDFVNMIFNSQPAYEAPWWIQDNIHLYGTGDINALHFNTIHAYDVVNGNTNGTGDYGTFSAALDSTQKNNIDDLTGLISGSGLNFMYERVKISKLCYSQRLIYEISNGGNTTENNGFCYQTCNGEYLSNDMGNTALHMDPNVNSPNTYIAIGIYENLQHGDLYGFNPQFADKETWFVKPRMRIDSSVVDNFPETEIVRIEIINYNNNNGAGTPINTVTIKAKHFAQNFGGTLYGGQYIDIYNAIEDPGFDLTIDGGNGSNHNPAQLNDGQLQDNWRNWEAGCNTDFRVKWLGNVDVWFDKMIVDDEFANEMFAGNFDDEIEDELTYYFRNTPREYTFFADELTYSQFEGVKYVRGKINEYCTAHTVTPPELHIAASNYHNTRGHKNNSHVFSLMYDILEPASVNIDAHELGSRTLIPYGIAGSTNFSSGWIASDYDEYTESIQENVFGDKTTITSEGTSITNNNQPPWHGSFVYQVAKAVEQRNTYSPDTKVIIQPQIHSLINSASSNGGSWIRGGLREPTNEEIEAQAMISIARGADGLCWFWYPSDIIV